jgi:serine/threonine-protein kinase
VKQLALDGDTWTILGPLDADRSGFGAVFEAESSSGSPAVVKAVPKVPGAQRELLVGDFVRAAGYTNVVPILDSGEDDECWFLVMPRADRSLAQLIANASEPMIVAESLRILRDVASALAEIDGQLVHRDIKPANILLHDGVWKLADFGIARYSEASTADDTRKHSFTHAYAAPEQWEHQHATGATDVYAFGVLAYYLLTGELPFQGPDLADYRQQHLTQNAPEVTAAPVRLRILVEECLFKNPDLRPHPPALLARLESVEQQSTRPGASKLAQVSHAQIKDRARQQAEYIAERDRREQFSRKVAAAAQAFESVAVPLQQTIEDNAVTAVFQNIVGNDAPRFRVDLADATLTLGRVRPVEHWDGPFAVIAYADIAVDFGRRGRNGWIGRSHSLWYCDAQEQGRYAWYELAFMNSALSDSRSAHEPYSCSPHESEYALRNVIGGKQIAWPVSEIDRADPIEFIDRWIEWFADAATGKLRRPAQMPERPAEGTWRK